MENVIKCTVWLVIFSLGSCATSRKAVTKKKSHIIYRYGTQQLFEGNITTALENLIEADKMEPDNPDILNNLALAYYYKKRPATAKMLFQRVLKLSPEHSDALNNMGTISMKEGKLALAEQYFTKVSKQLLFKKQFLTYHNLSKIAYERGQIPRSRKYNTLSLEEFDRYCPALFHKGLLFYKEKNWQEANKSLKEAMSGTCYNYHGSHYYRAVSLKNLKQPDLAEQILERFKMNFPKSHYSDRVEAQLKQIRKMKRTVNYSIQQRTLNAPQF